MGAQPAILLVDPGPEPGEPGILAPSLASQALFAYAPVSERARRVVSKLRQAPRLIQAARDNIKYPPGIFVKAGVETLQGTLSFIEEHLLRAFAGLDDLHLLGDLADCTCWAISPTRQAKRHVPFGTTSGTSSTTWRLEPGRPSGLDASDSRGSCTWTKESR